MIAPYLPPTVHQLLSATPDQLAALRCDVGGQAVSRRRRAADDHDLDEIARQRLLSDAALADRVAALIQLVALGPAAVRLGHALLTDPVDPAALAAAVTLAAGRR